MVAWFHEQRWYLLFLVALIFIAYVNSLSNIFVSDDRGVVINAKSLSYAFSEPLTSLRPMLNFIVYQIGGLNPSLFRSINIFFHFGVVFLSFFLISHLSNRFTALVGASLFAIHPILVEAVTWISGGVYVQYAFFFLLAFTLYMLGKTRKEYYFFSIPVFALGLLSSEKAVVLALIFPLYEILFGDIKKNWKRSLPFFALSGLYTFLYLGELGQRASALASPTFGGEKVFYNPAIQIPIAITSYLELIFWPDKLTLYHSETIYTQIEYAVRLVIFTGIFLSSIVSLRFTKIILFWFAFFLITLLPTLNPFGLTWIVAERYVYLGTLGIIALTSFSLSVLTKRKVLRGYIYAVVAILIVVLTIRTVVRNTDWYNEDTLWLSAVRTSPSSPQNHNNLGDLYGRRGEKERSIAEFQEAIRLKPNYADAHHNLGNAYVESGKLTEAIESYKKAIEFNPTLWQSYQNLAAIYLSKEEFDIAIEYAKKAVEANPKDPNLMVNLAIVYLKAGKTNEAREQLLAALSLDPTNIRAKEVLSTINK